MKTRNWFRIAVLIMVLVGLMANANLAFAGDKLPPTETATAAATEEQSKKVQPQGTPVPTETQIVVKGAAEESAANEEAAVTVVEVVKDHPVSNLPHTEFYTTQNCADDIYFAYDNRDGLCREEYEAGNFNIDWSDFDALRTPDFIPMTVDFNENECIRWDQIEDPLVSANASDGITSNSWSGVMGEDDHQTMDTSNLGQTFNFSLMERNKGWGYKIVFVNVRNPCWEPGSNEPEFIKVPMKVKKQTPAPQNLLCINPIHDIVANDGNGNFTITNDQSGKVWHRFTIKFEGRIDQETANGPCYIDVAGKATDSDQFEIYKYDYNGNLIKQLTQTENLSEGQPALSPNLQEVAASAFDDEGNMMVVRFDADSGENHQVVRGNVEAPSYTSDGNIAAIDSETHQIVTLDESYALYVTTNPLTSEIGVEYNIDGTSYIAKRENGSFMIFDFAIFRGETLPTANDYCISPDGNHVCRLLNGMVNVAEVNGTEVANTISVEAIDNAVFAQWGYQTTTNEMQSKALEARLQKIALQRSNQTITYGAKDEGQPLTFAQSSLNSITSAAAVAPSNTLNSFAGETVQLTTDDLILIAKWIWSFWPLYLFALVVYALYRQNLVIRQVTLLKSKLQKTDDLLISLARQTIDADDFENWLNGDEPVIDVPAEEIVTTTNTPAAEGADD